MGRKKCRSKMCKGRASRVIIHADDNYSYFLGQLRLDHPLELVRHAVVSRTATVNNDFLLRPSSCSDLAYLRWLAAVWEYPGGLLWMGQVSST
jgi:hypothetical protein